MNIKKLTIIIITIMSLISISSSNAELYRTATDYSTLQVIIDGVSNTTYSDVLTYTTPTVICNNTDEPFPPINPNSGLSSDCITYSSNLLMQSNDTYSLTSLAEHNYTHYVHQRHWSNFPYNLPITNLNTREVFMVTLFCYKNLTGIGEVSCNSGWNGGVENQPQNMNFRFLNESFDKVPSGHYGAIAEFNIIDYASEYLILRPNFNFNISVYHASEPILDTELYALQGNTLPITFSSLNNTSSYGNGSLSFCLKTDNYSDIDLYIIGDGSYLHSGKVRGRFFLTNSTSNSNDGGDSNRSSIGYYLQSKTLGFTRRNKTLAECSSSDTEFCLANVKSVDFRNLPDQSAPNGQTCKSFDITATTELFNPFQKVSGNYSGQFYINVDKGT